MEVIMACLVIILPYTWMAWETSQETWARKWSQDLKKHETEML